jgi:hypothetical protein
VNVLHFAFLILVSALALRGEGPSLLWLGLGLLPAILRAALSPDHERRLRGWMRKGGWRAAAIGVVLPAAALFLANNRQAVGGDEWPVISTVCSLVSEGTLRLDGRVALAARAFSEDRRDGLPYGVVRTEQGMYSKYPYGMVPFALPFAVLARLAGANLAESEVHGRIAKWAGAWTTACSLGLFWLLARRSGGPRPARWATLFLTLSSALFTVCGQALCQHSGLVFWLLVVLLVEFRRTERTRRGGVAWQGLACGMMLACRPTAALLVVPLGAWVLLRSPRRATLLTAATCLAYVPWAALYMSIYGSPIGPYASYLGNESHWTWPSLNAAAATLVSPGRGLLIYQPWLLAGLVGGVVLLRRPERELRAPTGWRWFCAGVCGLYMGMISCFNIWWGGHCYGTRYLAEVLPLLALLCLRPIAALLRRPAGITFTATLLLVGFGIHASAIFGYADSWNGRVDIDYRPEMVWSWSHAPFFDGVHPKPALGRAAGRAAAALESSEREVLTPR